MTPFAKVKRVTLFLVLLCLLCETGYSQNLNQTEEAKSSSFAEQKKIIDGALDSISIEVARQYVRSKKTKFPEIKTVTELEEFLSKIYLDQEHELRQAVTNFQQYKDKFSESDVDDVKGFLKNGVKQYAVKRDGKAFDFDRGKIETIINETESKVKPPSLENENTKQPTENKKSGGVFASISEFLKQNSLLLIGILLFTNLCSLLLLVFQKFKGNKSYPLVHIPYKQKEMQNSKPLIENEIADNQSSTLTQKIVPENKAPLFIDEDSPKPVSTNGTAQSDWLVVKTSIAGKSHTENNPPIPCQDSNYYQAIGKGWGIAVVCDGAGSKEYSHFGSRFVVKRTGLIFENIIKQNGWQITNVLPPQDKWHEISKRAFAKIRTELEEYAKKHQVESGLLSCTIIVVIHSPTGVLATHIGDGRAAFCNAENEWKAVIKPYKGEEANQTVFITSVDWNEQDKYIESTVFEEKPIAFALMSDGCEAHSFEVNIYDEVEQKYKDPNKPFPKFFQPIVTTLKNFYQSQVTTDEIDAKWKRFIESGNEKLKNEPDDKTMILGILIKPDKI